MRSVEEILRRYRPAPAPGAAAPAGVPTDRSAERASELAPVFAALADTVAEARRRVAAAQMQSSQIRLRAAEEARDIRAATEVQAEQERAAAMVRIRHQATRERSQLLAEAEQEAERIRQVSQTRIDALVERVMADLDNLIRAPGREDLSSREELP